jgi:hypothetical protein
MTTKAERMAADVSHSGAAVVLDTVTTANGQLIALPAGWAGKYVDFTAIGQDVFIRFGTDTSVQVATTATTVGGAGALTHTGKEPHLPIPAGTTRPERIGSTITHFAHVSGATGGKLYVSLSTGDGL